MELNWNDTLFKEIQQVNKTIDNLYDHVQNIKDQADGDNASLKGQISVLKPQVAFIQDNRDNYMKVCSELLQATTELHRQLQQERRLVVCGGAIIIMWQVARYIMS